MVCLHQGTSAVTPVDGVIIMAFLNSLLDAFQLYLARRMQDVCAAIHTCAGLPGPPSSDVYDYAACCRDNLLKLSCVKTAGGVDKRVGILLGGRRRFGDPSWAGDCLKKSQIAVAFTRASGRFYALREDMSASVVTPRCGRVRQEGESLGLACVDTTSRNLDPRTKKNLERRSNRARSQIPWMRACKEAGNVWLTSLQIPAAWCYTLGSDSEYPAPIWLSPALWEALAKDGAEHVASCFRGPGHAAAQHVLDAAWAGYASMEWTREASDPKSLKRWSKGKRVNEVLGTSGDILAEVMRTDVNVGREVAAPEFREDVTKIYRLPKETDDSDSETEGAPSNELLRRTWRAARINCMTIHVRGGCDVLVMLPVAAFILTQHDTARGLPCNSGHQSAFDPCWLLRGMFVEFAARVRQLSDDDSLRTRTIFHKVDVVDFKDGCSTSIRHAGSDRPAFVMERNTAPDDADSEQWTKIIHVYPAMGLPKQHRGQQALLARCHTHLAAQVFAAVSQQWLEVEMYTSQIVRAFSKRIPLEEQESIFNKFLTGLDSLLPKQRLAEPDGQALSDFNASDPCVGRASVGEAWGDIEEFVRAVCGPKWSDECVVAADLVNSTVAQRGV